MKIETHKISVGYKLREIKKSHDMVFYIWLDNNVGNYLCGEL